LFSLKFLFRFCSGKIFIKFTLFHTYDINSGQNKICRKGAKESLEKLSKDYGIKIFAARNRPQASKWLKSSWNSAI